MPSVPPPTRPKPNTSSFLDAQAPPLRDVAATFLAVPTRIRSVRLPPIPLHARGRAINLGRVSVVHGVLGSGQTAVLRVIEARAGHLREMAAIAPGPVDVDRLSGGEKIAVTGLLLLDALSADGWLLIDDALEYLDEDNFDLFVAALVASGEQVVIVVKRPDVERLRGTVSRSCRLVDIADLRPWFGAGAVEGRRP